jgi:hypothetical protein
VISRASTALSRPDRALPSPESSSAHRPWRQGLHCDWIYCPRAYLWEPGTCSRELNFQT